MHKNTNTTRTPCSVLSTSFVYLLHLKIFLTTHRTYTLSVPLSHDYHMIDHCPCVSPIGYPQPVYRDIQQYMQQQQRPPPPPVQQSPVATAPPPVIPQAHSVHNQIATTSVQPPGKDRSRPRGRMTPYAFFVQERREYYRRHGVPVEFTAFSKECSTLWKGLASEDKTRYQKMSENDKERYRKESATYQASLGQPFRDNGSKRGRKRKEPGQPKRNM